MTGEGLAKLTCLLLVDGHAEFGDQMVARLGGQPDLEVIAQRVP